MSKLPSNLIAAIKKDAAETAQYFVNEFGESFNSKTDGDWDAEAFADIQSRASISIKESQHSDAWDLWREEFVSQTQQLASK